MTELELVSSTQEPRTRESLGADLRALALSPGDVVLVHASMRSIGWISGGCVAVIQALQDVVTEQGTIVMPAHSSGNSDPSEWERPPVPQDWHQIIRDTMPGFDPYVTPSTGMGIVAESFRSCPGVVRSNHPNVSFSAWGKEAVFVTKGHQLAMSLGENSPLARVADLQGLVLLLGVGYSRCTSFHLAEYRSGPKPLRDRGAAILEDGNRKWATYSDIDFDEEPFGRIGEEFDATGSVRFGTIGSAESRMFSQPEAVEFARQWMIRNPPEG